MPNIPTYEQPDIGLRPSEAGPEAFAAAGRRGGAFYNQAGESLSSAGARLGQSLKIAGDTAVDYMDHQQINAGADHGATLFANITDAWNKTAASADPHDPTVAAKFREEQVEPALQQFQEGFTTEKSQEWASRFVNNLRQHMFEKTEADMSSLAATAVQNTVHNLANKFSNVAISDPSSVPAIIDNIDHSIDGILGANPNIKGPDAARVKLEVGEKIKEQIVKAGAFGVISNAADPEAAATAWTARFPDYINGEEAHTLARAAKTQARANLAASKQAEYYQKQLDTMAVDQARNKIWSDNVTIGPDGHPQIKPDFFRSAVSIPAQYPKAPNAIETARTLIDWGEAQQKPGKMTTDAVTARDLDTRMFAADNPTTEIQVLRAEADGKMTHADGQIRREIINARDNEPIKNPQFKYAIAGAQQLIEGRTPAEKLMSTGKFAGFMQQFLGEYLKQSRAGTLPPNALDLNDPKSLISQMMPKDNLGQIIRDNGGVGGSAAPPIVINSKADYDKLAPGTPFTHNGKQFIKPEAGTLAPGNT